MKFYNYINESDDIEKIKKTLEKDCNHYLNQLTSKNFLKKDLLVSGRKKNVDFGIGDIRKKRNPRNTENEFHEWIDGQFNKTFGIKARSQTLFCFDNVSSATNYGAPHYIFPIGRFEVIWSKEFRDLYSTRPYMDAYGLEGYKEFFLENILPTYIKGNLKDALKSGNEIMLYCESFQYYMMKSFNKNTHELLSILQGE